MILKDYLKKIENPKWIIWPGLTLVIFLVALIWFIVPEAKSVFKMSRDIKNVTAKIKDIKNRKNLIASLDEEKTLGQYVLTIAALPEKDDPAFFTEALINVFSQNLYSLEEFKFSSGAGGEETVEKGKSTASVAREANFNGVAIGPGSKVLDLLTALEASLPLVEVKRFSFALAGESTKLEFLITFFYSPKTELSGDISSLQLKDLVLDETENKLLSEIENYLEFKAFGQSALIPGQFGRENPFSP